MLFFRYEKKRFNTYSNSIYNFFFDIFNSLKYLIKFKNSIQSQLAFVQPMFSIRRNRDNQSFKFIKR